MKQNYFNRGNLTLKEKLFSFDFILVFLILLLAIISFFTMYSTEKGNLSYYTQSHVYRFFSFFLIFILVSLVKINFWNKLSYLFYFIALILLFDTIKFSVNLVSECEFNGN